MTINVGINGFGRIGRSTLSHIIESARIDTPLLFNAHHKTKIITEQLERINTESIIVKTAID